MSQIAVQPGNGTAAGTPVAPAEPVRESKASRAFNEGFRLLALNVDRALAGESRRSILVLSAKPGEGRSTTALGLATALAEVSPPVVLIDGDPDGSAVKPRNVTSPAAGANGKTPALQVINPWYQMGTTELFYERVLEAMEQALANHATVVIDGPACTRSSAGFYMATSVGGVLYVSRDSSARSSDGNVHHEVRAQLDMLGARVLGVVANRG